MAKLKKGSVPLENAKKRLAAMMAIDETLDLGNQVSVASFKQNIMSFEKSLQEYNTLLATCDARRALLLEQERQLSASTEHLLISVAAKFGKDSIEYQKAGGVRKSDRKRPKLKVKTA